MNKSKSKKIVGVGWFLYDADKRMVCVHRRDSRPPKRANMWDHFGGHAEDIDRTELDTLAREVNEELGITIERDRVIEINRENGQVMYVIPFPMDRTSEIKCGEGAGFAWLTLAGALSLKDLTQEARNGLSLLLTVPASYQSTYDARGI